jgi:hypothetical protein
VKNVQLLESFEDVRLEIEALIGAINKAESMGFTVEVSRSQGAMTDGKDTLMNSDLSHKYGSGSASGTSGNTSGGSSGEGIKVGGYSAIGNGNYRPKTEH